MKVRLYILGTTCVEHQLGDGTRKTSLSPQQFQEVILPPCPRFTDEETKAPGGEGTCLEPHHE